MSFSLDVNVLLYASNADCAEHQAATAFLQRVATGRDLCGLAWPTVMGYLRIATHPSIFPRPLPHAQAMANIDALLALPHVRTLSENERFWPIYRDIAGSLPLRGNLVPDAHLAALLHAHGIKTLYSRDRDFRKFDGIELRDPLA